ncbi:uncharacterized protein TOT_020000836 [Theileria orientalis strain Shintoku]|uniref:Theileria-specific sub-telomeric protein, SVSP family n=1 Tax=Theileria orientalis strain Shintoku TaxID=869250 RepID=J4C3K1_THEOR|nr:uncharacterized protein TOT_020000836 [Theileria orientalis strain Shintoku]BAM40581.1 uncharacterized protein TOT_020000836 [Theileria orientalis strain Shintoku]|eukprot:XP_009690882.1 uncharacterized protein TOT_020000836 [Theileria orientalis strain Shintoku]
MNRYRRFLYVVLCLLLSNICDYVESPVTLEIPDEFPYSVGPQIITDGTNKQIEIPLEDPEDYEIDPGGLVPENNVDETSPEKDDDAGIKLDNFDYGIPKTIDPNELATEAELSYIYEKARSATLYLLIHNKKKPSEHSLIMPNIGPDERLPILLDLDVVEHYYLNCEFYSSHRIYKVKENMVFVGVLIDINSKDSSHTIIWKSKSYYEFANKIVANGLFNVNFISKVSVFHENGEIKHYIKTKFGWVERSRCIEIYINFTQCTYEYLHSEDGYMDIYTPRYDFKISKIKLGMGKLPFKSNLDLWEAKNKYEYAKKVECIRRTTKPSFYVVIMIYLFNGDLIKLISRDKKWYRVDPKLVLNCQLDLNSKDNSFWYYFYDNVTYKVFEAKEGYCFSSLKIYKECLRSEVSVWKSQNFSECAYKVMVDGIEFVTDTKNIIIYQISGKCSQLKLIEKKWIVIDPSIILDINDKESNIGYNYFKGNGEIEYFIPNGGIVFKEVIAISGFISTDIVPIFKAKSKYEYVYKAIVIRLEKNAKYLVLLLVNNDILLFHRLDKGHPWIQRSLDDSTLHELKMMKVDLTDHRVLYKKSGYKITDKSIEIMPSEPSLAGQPQPVVPVSNPMPVMIQDKLVDLDIAKVYGIRGYDIYYKDDKLIFEARDNYFFRSVRKNHEILWKSKNNSDFPNKVLYKRVDNTDKIKVYFPDKIKEDPPKPKPKLSFDPSTIQVEVAKCKKPGYTSKSDLYRATVVEVSGKPATQILEDPDDFYVPPSLPRQSSRVFDLDD